MITLRITTQYSADVRVHASVEADELYATRHANLELWTVDPPPATVRVTPDEQQTLYALDGRIQLEIPAGAVSEPVVMQLQWSRPLADDPSYLRERMELTAFDEQGEAVRSFEKTLRLIINHKQWDDAVDLSPG
jgi:hypothetical protein